MRNLRCSFGVVLAAVAVVALSVPLRAISDDEAVAALIRSLADRDPNVRATAAEALRKLDEAARPAVVAASRSDDITLASAAADLLVSMPWYRRDDPQAVRLALRQYGRSDEVQRIAALGDIVSTFPRPVVQQILPRLLMEEPSEDVCWHIVAALRRLSDAELARALRKIDPGTSRASALVAIARAWFDIDPERAMRMLRRAIEIEQHTPTYDDGELDFAFDVLAASEKSAGRYEAAADLRRQQSSRLGLQRDSYGTPVFQLFVLHAQHGPLEGFEADAQTYRVYLAQPQVLYALSQTYQRGGDELSASVLSHAARLASLRGAQRLRVAQFLVRSGWHGAAERELSAILAANPENDEAAIQQVNARLRLAGLARERDKDAQAAEHVSQALRLIETGSLSLLRVTDSGREMPLDPSELRGEIAWLEFRAARTAGDEAAMERHLAQLLLIKPAMSRVVVDVVPYLKSRGRESDAQTLFNAAYAAFHVQLEAAPNEPAILNELAWLCARSGERLDEALELAERALAAAPADPAYLDTAAEANFQVGRVQEAIRLERAALELRPGDQFFTEQLERFQQALEPATRPAATIRDDAGR